MKRVRKTLEFPQSAGLVEAPSPESGHLALETPPDYVKEISRYLAVQSTQDQASEAESDSGDSMFITQNPASEAESSLGRQSNSPRPEPESIRQLEEEDSSSSSSSSSCKGKSKTVRRKRGRRRTRITLPQYKFPWQRALLSIQHNTALHYNAMGGFFKCVKELQQGRHGGDDLPSSLQTVDEEGESISPLSEDEEEGSESVDTKVVERKCFVFVPSKTKRSQPQKSPETRGSNVNHHKRNASKGQKASQGRKKTKKSMSKELLSHTEDSDGEGPSQSILAHSETPTRKRYLTRGNKKYIQGKESERELCDDSDATYCDPLELQGSPRLQDTVKDREASLNVTEPPADDFIADDLSEMEQAENQPESPRFKDTVRDREASLNVTEPPADDFIADDFIADDLSQMEQAENQPESKSPPQSPPEAASGYDNESVCNETMVRKERKGDDERRGQSQEDPGGLPAATSVEVEEGETPSPTEDNRAEDNRAEDNRAEPPATQTSDELENLSHDEVIARQEERHIQVSQPSLTQNVVNGDEERKKKGKSGIEDEEQLKASVVSEPLKDDGEILTKNQKGKEEKIVNGEEHGEALNMSSDLPLMSGRQLEETGDCLENTESTQEKLQPILEKKRQKREKKRPSADQEDTEVGAKDDADSSLSNDVTTETSSVKKKKKKKKIKEKKRESNSEGVDSSCIAEVDDADHSQKMNGGSEDRAPESVMKKKKKKRESNAEGIDISCTFNQNEKVDDADLFQKTEEGSDDRDAEPVTKKKKKKKRENASEDVDVYCTPNKKEKVNDADHSQKTKEDSDDRAPESVMKKKKKNKRESTSEGVDISCTFNQNEKVDEDYSHKTKEDSDDRDAEPVTKKKKTKKKKKKRESTAEDVDVYCTPNKKEKVDDADHSQKTKEDSDDRAPESVMKKKKKRESTAEGVDISCTFNQNEKVDDADHSHKTKEDSDDRDAEPVTKKKKKTKKRESTAEDVDVYCTPNKKEKVDDADHSQKTKEDSDDRDAESVTKKKKKKKREILSRAVSQDGVTQSHDSVSVRKKKRTSSFLVADAEEKEAQTHEEQSSPCPNSAAAKKPGVSAGAPETESAETAGNVEELNNGARKKKKKRKVSVVEESVEPNDTCNSSLPDPTETRVKRKKKSKRNESELVTAEERIESADEVGYSPTDEAVVLRKKKSKKRKSEPEHVIQESPTPATDSVVSGGAPVKTCSSVSLKKKGKQSTAHSAGEESCGHSAEESRDVSAKTSKETLNMPHHVSPSAQTPGVLSEAVRVKKTKKNKRAKTKLYYPSEDLYTDQ
ncbi:phoenix [Limanda limanda]|uniref:phoenix n=1 Tax=Limanda limanda TaxID=27771 RepID=UPI0029C91F06|nr:phoenix [Limanda limanda]